MNTKIIIFALFSLVYITVFAQEKPIEPALIPFPQKLEMFDGRFQLSSRTQLIVKDQGRFWKEIFYLQSLLSPLLGQNITTNHGDNCIEVNYSSYLKDSEAYELTITSSKVLIEASNSQGLFYALQTIRQLLPEQVELNKKVSDVLYLPALHIFDKPAFAWRGTMIDVSRHFFSIDYLKKHIDRMAFYKMNKLHLHLTDDQGWRIEIKKYPALTSQGAWREFNNQDTVCMNLAKDNPDFNIDQRYIIKKDSMYFYGGYFTQNQIRDLVQYAADRHVDIIPEIDMPGHMLAAITSYPYLADAKGIGWGKLFSTPLCPCKEDVYTFVEDVLTEIMGLFPCKYIHIGADEVDKTIWEKSVLCKKFMEKENIKSLDELQTHFVHRVSEFIKSKGRKVIVWDDVLDDDVDSSLNVMYWRGWVKGSLDKASLNGNPVIMSPTNPLYFDYTPDKSSLRLVYDMNVVHDIFSANKVESLVQGAQANLWSEKIPSEQRADYLMFPRLTALAERLWTNQDLYDSYSKRLLTHFSRLDAMKVHYRLPDLTGFALEGVFVKEALFTVHNPLPQFSVYYTLNGSIPDCNSNKLEGNLKINKPVQLKFALLGPNGNKGDVYTVNYRQMSMAESTKLKGKVTDGLSCSFYDGLFGSTKKVKKIRDKEVVVPNVIVPKEFITSAFALKYKGYIKVPETGIYNFYFTCDDGGMLYINNQIIVDNDGLHSSIEKSGQAALTKGVHPFCLDFVEGGGGFTLKLQYSLNGSVPKDVPDSWFLH